MKDRLASELRAFEQRCFARERLAWFRVVPHPAAARAGCQALARSAGTPDLTLHDVRRIFGEPAIRV